MPFFIRPCRTPFLRSRIRSFSSKAEGSFSTLPKPRLDYRAISENVVYKSHNAFNRKSPLPVGTVQAVARVYTEQKEISGILNAKRNAQSMAGERVRTAASKGSEAEKKDVVKEAKTLKSEIARLEEQLSGIETRLLDLALAIPNDTHPLSPLGPESAAATLSTHGPTPLEASPSRDHVSVGRTLGLLDFEAGATTTGSSWYYLLGEAALLEMALVNYALSIAVKHGYTPVITPDVVRSDVAYRCGFQPRDLGNAPTSQMYHIAQPPHDTGHTYPELVLAGTAEIPLAGLYANKVISASALPTRLVGVGRSFRAEAGSRGADTRGLYRVHQFTKVELFAICGTEDNSSEDLMEEIKNIQIEIFEGLGFPFRVLDMPTEELGASAYRKYDMEAWMPGRGSWGEISSASNCTDYQARRLHIRYRRDVTSLSSSLPYASAGLPFVHTLNGTAAAIPRLIVALFENGARFGENGEIVGIDLPEALKPFWVNDSRSEEGVIRWV